jgi:hypothetical protein
MRILGFVLMTAGFLAGTLAAVQTEANEVHWNFFLPAIIVAVIGIVLSRLGDKREAEATASTGHGVRSLYEAMDRVVVNIQALHEERESLDPYDVHGRLDELFVEDLNLFADHRKQIISTYNLQAYAEIMNEFAAGERYLNRCWSASVDGYIDEIKDYLGKARVQFERTQEILARLKTA